LKVLKDQDLMVFHKNPHDLKPHSLNSWLYKTREDSDFLESVRRFGVLEPLVVNRDGVILSGHRRWKAALKLGYKSVPCVVEEFENDKVAIVELNRQRVKTPREIYREAQVLRRELEPKAKVGRPPKNLGKFTKINVRDQAAEKVGVSSKTLYMIEKIYENEDKIPEVVEKLDKSEITVHRAYRALKQAEHRTQPSWVEVPEAAEELPQELYPTNIWVLPRRRPVGYGSKDFKGNCDPTIIDQCLRRYLGNPHYEGNREFLKGVVVLDPMAGSGTTLDVARRYDATVIGIDINPRREDVQFGDARKLDENGIADESVDFIFCHYPYWNVWKYSTRPEDLSNQEKYSDFLLMVEETFKEFKRVLKPNCFLCVLIGNKRERGVIDIEADFSTIGRRYFRLWDKIVTVAGDPAGHAHTAHGKWNEIYHRALKNKWTIQNYNTLLVFKKEMKR